MKKLNILIIALAVVCILSCHRGKHVVIATQSGNSNIRLEYSGSLAFSSDGTKIEGISKGGYFDFKRNDDQLHVSRDENDHIVYELNGTKLAKPDGAAQSMLNEAIRMATRSGR